MKSTIVFTIFMLVISTANVCSAAGFAYVWQTFDQNNVMLGLPPIPDAFKWPPLVVPPNSDTTESETKSGEEPTSVAEKTQQEISGEEGSTEKSGTSEGSSETPSSSPASGESGESGDSREKEKEPGSDKEETTPTSPYVPVRTFKGFPPVKYSPLPLSYTRKSYAPYSLAPLALPPPPRPAVSRLQYLPYKAPPLTYPSAQLLRAPYFPLRAPYSVPLPVGGKSSGSILYSPFIAPNITAIPSPTVIRSPKITAISPKLTAAINPYRVLPPTAPLIYL